jgi:phospholipid/cholesterol/gamma-HCH transport system substrate-binding protein
MRRNAIEVITGVIVLIVAFGFLGYALSRAGNGGGGGGGYPLYASFSSIAGLNVGSDVRLAGVKVGSVEVDPKSYLARVTMDIRNGIELPKDSGVSVASESLLGGEYLSISPGGDSQTLKPGQSFTATQGAVSLQDLLGKFIFSATNMVSAMTGSQGNKPAGNTAWPQPDGSAVSCREKLKMLEENHAELAQVMRDAFEDAVLMGVDEQAMRQILAEMVAGLESPKQAR